MYDGEIQAVESIGFIIMYVVYLVVLIGGHLINRRLKERRAIIQANTTETVPKNYGSIQSAQDAENGATTPLLAERNAASAVDDESYFQPDVTFALSLRHAFLPREDTPWSEKGKINKVLSVIKVSRSRRKKTSFSDTFSPSSR